MANYTITADWMELLKQSGMTTEHILRDAVESIDKQFGKGYAEQHPELVGAFLQAAATDFAASSLTVAAQHFITPALQEVAEGARAVSTSNDKIADAVQSVAYAVEDTKG